MPYLRAWPAALLIGACAARTSAPARSGPSVDPTHAAGGPIDRSLDTSRASVARIELCKTTEADLRVSFGPSMRDGRLARYRVQSWLLAKDPERVLGVLLDARGVVVDLEWDTPGDVSWVPRDSCAGNPAP